MLFEYRYFGNTAVESRVSSTGLSFSPDTSREPTYFTGMLRQQLAFRECISALHHVVVSDLRFQPKDRTEYFAWAQSQENVDMLELLAKRKQSAERIASVQTELDELRSKRSGRHTLFQRAQKRYFNWMYQKACDFWFVFDPVITVHPDEIFFECFSQDESSYGRVGCSYEVFDNLGELACGTTNVDYSSKLYDEFQKIRDYKSTALTVDPRGFEVRTATDEAYREVQIDLPDSWVRGFLQVSSAMSLEGARFDLHPMDVHNFILWLRRHKADRSPRSLRFHLEPGQPIRVTFEPWKHTITCPRSVYTGPVAREIRVWGRRRLFLLERLVAVARRFHVVLLGTGMPSFWIADCGDLSFTLGLSGWTANDWSAHGNFDLLAPRGEVDTATAVSVFEALRQDWFGTAEGLATKLNLDVGTVKSALAQYTQAGRVMYDLNKGVFRVRELSRQPLDMSTLRFSNPREEKAAQLVAAGSVTQLDSRIDNDGNVHLNGQVGGERPSLRLNPDRRLAHGKCGCSFYFRNRLRRGPCEHLLALRLAFERSAASEAAALDLANVPPPVDIEPAAKPATPSSTSRVGQVIRLADRQPRRPPTEASQEGARFLELLLDHGALEVVPGRDASLAHALGATLQLPESGRARALIQLFDNSPDVDEYFLSEEDITSCSRSGVDASITRVSERGGTALQPGRWNRRPCAQPCPASLVRSSLCVWRPGGYGGDSPRARGAITLRAAYASS